MKLRLSEQAREDIQRIDAWWAKHRSKNPLRFRQELLEVLEHIEATPTLAGTYKSKSGKKYWKVLTARPWRVNSGDPETHQRRRGRRVGGNLRDANSALHCAPTTSGTCVTAADCLHEPPTESL